MGLIAAAINNSSATLLILAVPLLGATIGGSLGFLIGGKNGVGIGAAVGGVFMLFAYALLPDVQ